MLASLTVQLQSRPDCGALYLDRAKVYLSLGDTAKALDDLDRAISCDEGLAEAYMIRGKLRFGLHEKNAAFCDLQKAVSLNPDLLTSLSGEFRTPGPPEPFKVKF